MSNVNEWWAEEEGEDGIEVVGSGWDFDISKSVLVSSAETVFFGEGSSSTKLTMPCYVTVDDEWKNAIATFYNANADSATVNMIRSPDFRNVSGVTCLDTARRFAFTDTGMSGPFHIKKILRVSKDKWALAVRHTANIRWINVLVDAPASGNGQDIVVPESMAIDDCMFVRSWYYYDQPVDVAVKDGFMHFLVLNASGYVCIPKVPVGGRAAEGRTLVDVGYRNDSNFVPKDGQLDPDGNGFVIIGNYGVAGSNTSTQSIMLIQYRLDEPFNIASAREAGRLELHQTKYDYMDKKSINISRDGKSMLVVRTGYGNVAWFESYRLSK